MGANALPSNLGLLLNFFDLFNIIYEFSFFSPAPFYPLTRLGVYIMDSEYFCTNIYIIREIRFDFFVILPFGFASIFPSIYILKVNVKKAEKCS